MIGLGNVDNISDANKAVSTATQTALNLKANLINPTFTSDITLSTTGANEIIFNTNASTPNYNYIGYDATNNLNILCNNQSIITSSGTTTNINTDIYSTTTNSIRRLTLESTNSGGGAHLTLKCRNNFQSSIHQGGFGLYIQSETSNIPIEFIVNNGTTNLTPLKIRGNGVVHVGNNTANNKMLILYDQGTADDPATATNFFGFGVNSNILRYQAPVATNSHRFFCGSTLSFTITNGAGASGSDLRWKSEIENIDGNDALNKVNQIQAKSFKYQECEGRQYGFIAQDIKPLIPELVNVDNESEEKYMYLHYDRFSALHHEAIKELYKIIQGLEARIVQLENK